MDNKKDWLDEMLSDNSVNDTETLEMISDNCEALSGEQKNRILDMIREKESTDNKTEEITRDDIEDENVMSVVEFRNRKSIAVKICAAFAACICIVTGIKFAGDMNGHFIPSEDDSEKITGVSETVLVTDNTGVVTVPDTGNVTVIPEQVRTTEITVGDTVSDEAVTTSETVAGKVSEKADIKQVTEQTNAVNESVTGVTVPETASENIKTTELTSDNKEAAVTSENEYHEVSQTEVTAGPEESDTPQYIKLYKKRIYECWFPDIGVDNAYFSYILYDMNKDGVPELIMEFKDAHNNSIINFFSIEYNQVRSFPVKSGGYQLTSVSSRDNDPNYLVSGSVTFFEDSNTERLCIEILDNGIGEMVSFYMDGRVVYEADAVSSFEYGDDYNLFRAEAEKKFAVSDIEFGCVRAREHSVMSGHNKIRVLESGEYYF